MNMTKTKFKVDILSYGTENESILRAIANHNSGKTNIGLVDIRGWGKIKTAIYPAIPVNIIWHPSEKDTIIVEDNGVQTLMITKIDITELAETN
jgi:hypothetical protein